MMAVSFPDLPSNQMTSLLLVMLLILLLLQHVAAVAAVPLQCRDANGDPLDWFAMLKQPGDRRYAYISNKSLNSWIQPDDADLAHNGPVYQTLKPLFKNPATDVLAAYNDEPPQLNAYSHSSFGHMKGVVALTSGQSGFWLIHSVPKFPDLEAEAYTYPDSGVMYGQSFLCITVSSSSAAEAIGSQLFTSHPELYKIRVQPTVETIWPSWAKLQAGQKPPAQLMNSTVKLSTVGGLSVLHLAKSPHLINDLYAYLLTPLLDSSIQVESWQHGQGLLNSTCTRRFNVTKVLKVSIGTLKPFASTSDHSKWCVVTSALSKPYFCIGDMNRAESQFRRGGGIACIALPGPYKLFKAAVNEDQPCGGLPLKRPHRYRLDSALAGSDDAAERTKELLAIFNWILIGIACASACTLVSVALVLWSAFGQTASAGHSSCRYQHI